MNLQISQNNDEREKAMIKSEKYIVGTEKDHVYKCLYEMIPQQDKFLHYRLSGKANDVCTDTFFVTHEDGKGLSRVWMGYGRHENAACNWGAVFTQEEARGKGYCAMNLDYCFEVVNALENPPAALFCTAGSVGLTKLYSRYGFVPALKGADCGPLYRPCGNSPKTFQEFAENYYTPTSELVVKDADFGWRNEVDCLLKFALLDMGIKLEINCVESLNGILMDEPNRAKVVMTKENKCVGWMLDGIMQLHPAYENVNKITDMSTKKL